MVHLIRQYCWPLRIIVMLLLCGWTPLMAEGPFVDMDFEQALKEADKTHKVIFIDFYTTWCGPCKRLEQETWKDKKVIQWLTEKTIAMKLDAEKHEELSSKYNVDCYPTLLFLKPDGTVMDRLTGYMPAAEFLKTAEDVLVGKDAVTRAREKLTGPGKNNPTLRMEYAKALVGAGQQAEALKEYLWCYDEGIKHDKSFVGVRLSFLLYEISRMGESYPPAIDAMKTRRDAARQTILSGKELRLSVVELTALNEYLQMPQDSLALYDQLRREQPTADAIPQLRERLIKMLLEKHRYAEIAEGDLSAKIDAAFKMNQPSWFEKLLMLKYPKEQRELISDVRNNMLRQQVGQFYQVLIGLKRLDEANALAERLLKVDANADTYNALAWNGFLTGSPIEVNETQARQAYEMTKGQNASITDTLAHVLNARGKHQEAVELLQQSLEQTSDPSQRRILERCLANINGHSALFVDGRDTTTLFHRLSGLYTVGAIGIGCLLLILLILRRRRRSAKPMEPSASQQDQDF